LEISKLQQVFTTQIKPAIYKDGKTKLAAVLIVIYGKTPMIIMTEKPSHLKIHAGEIAFPGGKVDSDDVNLLETAMRETREEIDFSISKEKIVGQLSPVHTLNSGFTITPFVAVLDEAPKLSGNSEVESILHIPLISFLRTLTKDPNPQHNLIKEMHALKFGDKIIWGASARILKQISDILSKNNLL